MAGLQERLPEGPLEGRVAIVTGAGRGTGRAIAGDLVAAGASVIVADHGTSRDGEGADPTVARGVAEALGPRAAAFTGSVASPGAAQALVDQAVRTFGSLDIVVGAAAIRRDAPVFEAEPRDWDAVIRTNLSAPFYLARVASGWMRRRGRPGRIVNVVSAAAIGGARHQGSDAGAAAGLVALTRVVAADLVDAAITANAVAPFGRGDTAGIARLAVALCLPAADAVTGQFFAVRGRSVLRVGQPGAVTEFDGSTDPAALAGALAGAVRP